MSQMRYSLLIALAFGATVLLQPRVVEARQVQIYGGESVSASGISLSSWGSGFAEETTEEGSVGTRSLKITSDGLYSGGYIKFPSAIEIADPSVVSKYDYLELMVKFTTTTPLGLSDPGGKVPVNRDYRPLPADYYGNFYYDEVIMVPKARKMRIVLYSNDGRVKSHEVPVVVKQTDEEGWVAVAFPLAAMGIDASAKGFSLSRIGIAADYSDTLSVGQIRVITDDAPIFVESLDVPDFVGTSDTLVFKGDAEAGRTSLVYTWDFNDKDGIQEDAVGQIVQVYYRNPGMYTITLTVKDPDGIKEPKSAKGTLEIT